MDTPTAARYVVVRAADRRYLTGDRRMPWTWAPALARTFTAAEAELQAARIPGAAVHPYPAGVR